MHNNKSDFNDDKFLIEYISPNSNNPIRNVIDYVDASIECESDVISHDGGYFKELEIDEDFSRMKLIKHRLTGPSDVVIPLSFKNTLTIAVTRWENLTVETFREMFLKTPIQYVPTYLPSTENKTMSKMFYHANKFNHPINSWDVSGITDMSKMFYGAKSFNQPLNSWDVSKVKSMNSMFKNATSFNQPLDSWDVQNVEYMTHMFYEAKSFNQPLNSWDVSRVVYMSEMFRNAKSFNQNLNEWDLSSIRNMNGMFAGAELFNQPLSEWDVSEVNESKNMFFNTPNFNSDNIPTGYSSSKYEDKYNNTEK